MDFLKKNLSGLGWWLVLLVVGGAAVVIGYSTGLPGLAGRRKEPPVAVNPAVAEEKPTTAPFVPAIGKDATNSAPIAGPVVPAIVPGAAAGPKSGPFGPAISAAAPGPDGKPAAAFVPAIGAGATNSAPNAGPVVPPISAETAVPSATPAALASPTPRPVVISDDSQNRIKAAVVAYMSGDRQAARDLLAGIDLIKAGSAPAWELAGLLKEFDGDRKAAGDYYSRGIALTPTAGLYYRRAVLRRTAEDFPRALEDMDRAVDMASENLAFTNDRLLLLIQMGRKAQAGSEMKALSDCGGASSRWMFGFCGMALEKGDYRQAANLLANGKKTVPPEVFEQMLKNPVISRHQSRPELMRFFFTNLPP